MFVCVHALAVVLLWLFFCFVMMGKCVFNGKWRADEKIKAWIAADPTSKTKAMCVCNNAPIDGLPQDGGAGQCTGIRHRKAHVGGDFDLHKGLCIVCP